MLFDAIIDWKHHPKVIVLLSYVAAAFLVPITSPVDLITVFLVGSVLAIPCTLLLFLPYLFFVIILALCFSLLQAIATGFRRRVPATH